MKLHKVLPTTSVRPENQPRMRWIVAGVAPIVIAGGIGVVAYSNVHHADVAATAADTVTFNGRGLGHGRGMGQWGAFGYAKAGWTAPEILAHFYGGTQPGTIQNVPVTVSLSKEKEASVLAPGGAVVAGKFIAPGSAITLQGPDAVVTKGCGGPVTQTIPATQIDPPSPDTNLPANKLLEFCGDKAPYRGSVSIKDGKVVNIVPVESYLRGVVPSETIAAWGNQGGYEAIRAQAVAARSYAISRVDAGKILQDNQNSQVYGGQKAEHAVTDKAVYSTAGQVLTKDGKVAMTEFSASTGGYTAGGEFPAVIDAGDVTVSPYQAWTQTIPSDKISQIFGVGKLKSIDPAPIKTVGDGHVQQVKVVGADKTVTVSGNEFRTKLGLKSTWFSVDKPAVLPLQVGVAPPPVQINGITLPFTIPSFTLPPGLHIPGLSGQVPTTSSAPSLTGAPVPGQPEQTPGPPSASVSGAPNIPGANTFVPTAGQPAPRSPEHKPAPATAPAR